MAVYQIAVFLYHIDFGRNFGQRKLFRTYLEHTPIRRRLRHIFSFPAVVLCKINLHGICIRVIEAETELRLAVNRIAVHGNDKSVLIFDITVGRGNFIGKLRLERGICKRAFVTAPYYDILDVVGYKGCVGVHRTRFAYFPDFAVVFIIKSNARYYCKVYYYLEFVERHVVRPTEVGIFGVYHKTA